MSALQKYKFEAQELRAENERLQKALREAEVVGTLSQYLLSLSIEAFAEGYDWVKGMDDIGAFPSKEVLVQKLRSLGLNPPV